jgi:ABC-type nitrate/sulfonate/bicarbonate transport system permease component/SAM-dependent methyltransferase
MRRAAFFILVLGSLAVMAEALVRSGGLSAVFFPPPSLVLVTLLNLIADREFLAAIGASVWGMTIGFGLAILIAIPLGTAMGQWRIARELLDPIVDTLRPMPSAAVIPVAILLFGLGLEMKTAVVVFGSIWPVIINTMDAIRGVDPLLVDSGRMLGLTGNRLLRQVILPAALPGVFTGLRISLGIALILTVTTEMIAGSNGLGYFILDSQRSFLFREMFAGIVALGALGYLMTQGFGLIERRVLFWHVSVRRDAPDVVVTTGPETFSGQESTSSSAREIRRAINGKYAPHSLHEDFPEDLWPRVAPKRVLWLGIDVVSFVPTLAKRWPAAEFTAAHWRPVGLRDLATRLSSQDASHRVKTVHWRPEDGILLPGEEESFDVVGCTFSLHDLSPRHVTMCIHRLRQLLRPSGKAYFATHARGSFRELFDVYREAAAQLGFRRVASARFDHFDSFCHEDARKTLLEVFPHVDARDLDGSLNFPPAQGLELFVEYASIFPFPGISGLSSEDRERLWAAFQARAAELRPTKITKPSGVLACSV